jgi:hypothetical protein
LNIATAHDNKVFDQQTDALVYELHGLTEEEIGVVEDLDRE